VFVKNTDEVRELLADVENPYRQLFGVLRALREKYDAKGGPFHDMFQMSSIQSLFFELANGTGADSWRGGAKQEQLPFGPMPTLPRGVELVFLNLLWGTMFLSEELEEYIGCLQRQYPGKVHVANRASIDTFVSPRTIIFCFGLREDAEHQGC